MTPEAGKVIIECPTCRQMVRIPVGRRKLQLTCPKCRTTWLWSSEGADTGIPSFEVRPKAKRNAIILAVLSTPFIIGGVWMFSSGEEMLAGLLSIAFGIAGLWCVPRAWRRDTSMVLTGEGLKQRYSQGSTLIPWTDVERISVMRMRSAITNQKMVGIRLKSYDRYLNDMSPELAKFAMRGLRAMKLFARGASMVKVHGGVGLWLAGAQRPLKSFGKVGSLAEAMMWSREQFGYDVAFAWGDLDRSPEEFVALLEDYRRRACGTH